MLIQNRKTILVTTLLVLAFLLAIIVSSGATASEMLAIMLPEEAGAEPIISPPLLAPPISEKTYTDVSVRKMPELANGRFFATLKDLPKDVTEAKVFLVPQENKFTDEFAFEILSSVEYRIDEYEVLLSLTRPSSKASETEFLLGNKTVELKNGTKAYITSNSSGQYENQIVYIDGELIVTIASDMQLDELYKYVDQVEIDR